MTSEILLMDMLEKSADLMQIDHWLLCINLLK